MKIHKNFITLILAVVPAILFFISFFILKNTNFSNVKSSFFNVKLGPAPGRYVISDGSDSIKIPFKFTGNKFVVEAEMNGKKLHMMVDNGVMWDQLFFFGSPYVDSLGIKFEDEILVTGAGDGNGERSHTSSGLSIKFSGIEFFDQPAIISSKGEGLSQMFPGSNGQVSGAFFKHFITRFDFDENTITLYKPDNFRYKGNGRALRMKRDSIGAYSIPFRLNLFGADEFDYELFIDLGGSFPLFLTLNSKIQMPEFEKKAPILLGYGASGEIYGYKGKLSKISLANYEFKDVFSVFVKTKSEGDNTSLTVGLPLLSNFNLTFDYINERLYLEPNKKFNEPIINE